MKLRLRFSVRTLVIVLTLVCAYFGAWEATKNRGTIIHEWEKRAENEPTSAEAILPLVIAQNEIVVTHPKPNSTVMTGTRRYYLWLFGPKIRLPYETPHPFVVVD